MNILWTPGSGSGAEIGGPAKIWKVGGLTSWPGAALPGHPRYLLPP